MAQAIDPHTQDHLDEFREHLEGFYASLKLAPPYHSIEKALSTLLSLFAQKTQVERVEIKNNETIKNHLYCKAFIDSGLYKKHRGIITGMLKSPFPPQPCFQHINTW